MYEVRQIINDPYAVDGPLIISTDNLAEAQAAADRAARTFRHQLAANGEGAHGSTFITVLLDWDSYKPFPSGFASRPTANAWLTRWWDVVTIDFHAT